MEITPQTNRTTNSTDWRPGRANRMSKPSVPQPVKSVVEIIQDVLINYFLHENPRADEVKVVNNSLQLIDEAHGIWKAKVQTFIYPPTIEPRIHESSVRFRIDKSKNSQGKEFYSIYHNHIIFPATS